MGKHRGLQKQASQKSLQLTFCSFSSYSLFPLFLPCFLLSSVWLCIARWAVCAQSCLTLSYAVDCSLSGSSVQGMFQARILERVAMPSSRGSSPRDQTCISCTAKGFFYPLSHIYIYIICRLSWWLSSKESTSNAGAAGDMGLIPRWGRSPGRGHGNLLQYSVLENLYGQRSLVCYIP